MKNSIIAFILVSFFNLSGCPGGVRDSNSKKDHSTERIEEDESDSLLNQEESDFDDFDFDSEDADSIYLDDEDIDSLDYY